MTKDFLPEIETLPLSGIRSYQDQRLRELLSYLDSASPFYKRRFSEYGINAGKISGISDLPLLPVTTKEDLQRQNNEFLCVKSSQVADFITTSGTLGEPVIFALTGGDLDRLAYNEALSFTCAGGQPGEIYQLMTTLDRRFMAGMAYFLGIRKMGAGIVRVGSGIPELQWDTILRLSPDAIVAVPSFILKLIEYAGEHGIDFRSCAVRKAICIGESLRNPDFSFNTLAQKIMKKWPLNLYSTYASTEMSTSFTECHAGKGGHHHPELIIVELLDGNNRPVTEGTSGEVTVTTLGVEGMPLLRFKTGDICHHHTEPCPCGRTTMRLGPVIGRKNQMIKYKGTTLYPPALFDILENINQVENYIVEVRTNRIGTDDILIHAGCSAPSERLEQDIKEHFRARLRVAPEVKFHSPETINQRQFPDAGRKAVKFIDNRGH